MTPREWVTYEVQAFVDGKWRRIPADDFSETAVLADVVAARTCDPEFDFRAVAITHTERVIG